MDTLSFPVTSESSIAFAVTGAQVVGARLLCNAMHIAEISMKNIDPSATTPIEFFADGKFHAGLTRGKIIVQIDYIQKSTQFPKVIVEESMNSLTWDRVNSHDFPAYNPLGDHSRMQDVYFEQCVVSTPTGYDKRVICYTPTVCGYFDVQ